VAEVDPGLRESSRATPSRPAVFADYRELLDRCAIDAAVICLPTALHAAAAVACFERGLHVYLEKPLASTVEEGAAAVAAWRSAGTVGAIGYNVRFHPLAARLREALRQGELGEPIGAQTVFCAGRRTLPEWKRRRSSGGGVLLDLVSHHVDLVRFVFGSEIVEIGAFLRTVESEDDTAVLALRLANGPLVTILASLAAVEEDRVAVYGARGGLLFDRYRSSRLAFVPTVREASTLARVGAGGRILASLPRVIRDAARPPRERSFGAALAAFARAARGGEWTGADLDDGLRSLAVVVAAERAATSGETIFREERC
jgi:predicted dehydrogenase